MKQYFSPAKLNLFLYINERRKDGYHNLQTLFELVDFGDYLYFNPRNDNQINLITPFDSVLSSQNLIIKAANAFTQYLKNNNFDANKLQGFDIKIDKKIPMGAGLGGGSSNAATTLLALNKLWNINLSKETLIQLAKNLGADVAFFILQHSAYGVGIGEILTKVKIPAKWFLLVLPNIKINTADVFNHVDLKRDTVKKELSVLLNNPYKNDCETLVKKLYPLIDNLISILNKKAPTRLTGTGSCIFCECESQEHAKKLQEYLSNQPLYASIKSVVARSLR